MTDQAAFPLHEGRADREEAGEPSDRRLLFLEWAHWSNFYKKQPLWLIKRYFGDKVGSDIIIIRPIIQSPCEKAILPVVCLTQKIKSIFGSLKDSNTPKKMF